MAGLKDVFSIKNTTSVKAKIQKIIIAIVAFSMLVLGAVSCYLNYSSTVSSLQQSMEEMAGIAAARVEWQITAYKNVVQELGRNARLANDSYAVEEKQKIIDEKVKAYNCVRGKLIDTDGIARIDGTDYSDREYFKIAMGGETYLAEPLIAKTDGSISLIFAAPVWEGGVPHSTVVGVVFLVMQPDYLNDIVKDINISENSGAYIIDDKGTTVAHTTDGMVEAQNNTIQNAKTDSSLQAIADLEMKMLAGETGFGTYTYKGATKFMSYAPIGNTNNWSLGVNAPVGDFMGDTIKGIIITVVLAVLFILTGYFVAVRIGSSIGTPIKQCAERLNLLMDGDLQTEVPSVDSKDEVGVLSASTRGITEGMSMIINDIKYLLETMAAGDFTVKSEHRERYVGDYSQILLSLQEIKRELGATLANIKESSEQVTLGAQQMAENSQALAEGATEQAGAVEELTATIENITQLAVTSAENARIAYRAVDKSVEEAKGGERAMGDLTEAMSNITNTSQEIQNIITTIEDIASQTNLLSLNASIEAARAGEAGRGFAVVAEQIGKLASDSAQSAVDTKNLIVKVMNEIENGNKITNKTADVFGGVVEAMTTLAQMARGASEASDQQALMLEQVEQGVEQISGVVQSNSASAEEASATSEELSAQAESMNQIVEEFKFEH